MKRFLVILLVGLVFTSCGPNKEQIKEEERMRMEAREELQEEKRLQEEIEDLKNQKPKEHEENLTDGYEEKSNTLTDQRDTIT